MSLIDSDSKRTNELGTASYVVMNHQICPKCYKEMRVEVIAPTMFREGTDHITYACKGCGTEEIQTIRR